jgi:hypothetical protein
MDNLELRTQLLRDDLDRRFSELQAWQSVYASQTRLIALAGGLIIGFAGLASEFDIIADTSSASLGVGVVLITAMLFYLASNLAHAVFGIMVNSSRIKHIEEQLNEVTGCSALAWETKVIPSIYPGARLTRYLLLPSTFVAVWGAIVALTALLLLASVWAEFVGEYTWVFLSVLAGTAAFQGMQWWGMVVHGGRRIDSIVKGDPSSDSG